MKLGIGKLNLAVAILIGAISVKASAYHLRLDEMESIADATGDVATAFRVENYCHKWDYIPGRLVARPNISNMVTTADLSLENNTQETAYISTVKLTAAPEISSANLAALQQQIFDRISKQDDCANVIKRKEDIVLTPATVTPTEDVVRKPKTYYWQFFPLAGNDIGARSALNFEKTSDASNVSTLKELKDISGKLKDRILIGTVNYSLDGILTKASPHLKKDGKFWAEYSAALEKTSCTSDDNEDRLDGKGWAQAFVPGAIGAGSGGGFADYNKHGLHCNFEYLSKFLGGDAEFNEHIDFDGLDLQIGKDGKRTMDNLNFIKCDEDGECKPVTLESYIKFFLMDEFIRNNLGDVVQTIRDRTYNKDEKRATGTVRTSFNFSVTYTRAWYGQLGLSIPVYIDNVNPKAIDTTFTDSKLYKCAVENYGKQRNDSKKLLKGNANPVPLAPACLTGETGNQERKP